VTFLVGLLNWLSAIALHFIIPNGLETPATRAMDKLIASILTTVVVLMVSFYNSHVTHYGNLCNMVVRFKFLMAQQYLAVWPLRPLSLVLLPCMASVVYYLFLTFFGGL
jgi:hypothetical protein